MTPERSQWLHVDVGSYVRDPSGTDWRVDGKRRVDTDPDGVWRFALTGRDGRRAEAPMHLDWPIDVLVPSTLAEAEAIVTRHLPVTGVRRKVVAMEQLASYPDKQWVRQQLAIHLREMHHVSIKPSSAADTADLAGMLAVHAAAHASGAGMTIAHIHVPLHEL